MKKIASILLCIIIIFIGMTSYAVDDGELDDLNIELGLTSPVDIDTEKGQKEAVLTLSLENLSGIPDDAAIGYEATVEYDKDIFESLTVEELNNWDVNYEESTGKLLCELVGEEASANMQIAEFTFTIKEGVEAGETTVNLAGDEGAILTVQSDDPLNSINFECLCEKTATINIIVPENKEEDSKGENKEEDPNKQGSQAGEQTQTTPQPQATPKPQVTPNVAQPTNTTQTPQKSTNVDTTTAKSAMPATGVKTILAILLLIVVFGGIYLIKYKSIELK